MAFLCAMLLYHSFRRGAQPSAEPVQSQVGMRVQPGFAANSLEQLMTLLLGIGANQFSILRDAWGQEQQHLHVATLDKSPCGCDASWGYW